MSDSSMYELESIIWDDFSESNDHRVPCPVGKLVADFNTQGDHFDKLRHEIVTAGIKRLDKTLPAKDVILRRPDANRLTLKGRRDPLQEKGPWFHTPESLCTDVNEADCLKEVIELASDDVNNCFKDYKAESLDNDFFMDEALLDEKNATIDGNMCHFPLNDFFSTGGNLDFLGNEHENKCSYLPYYERPYIDKFEDLDRIFRGFDSTFGQGNVTNEDDMSLFSSSPQDVDGSEDVFKSGFESLSPGSSTLEKRQCDKTFSENDASLIIDSSGVKNITEAYKMTSQTLDSDASATLSCSSLANWSGSNAEDMIKSVSEEQPMESSSNPSPNTTKNTPEEKRGTLHKQCQTQVTSSVAPQLEVLVDHSAFTGLHQIHDKLGGYCEVERLRMELSAAELDSYNVQESSCVSSILSEEISLKTISFQQLQLVMQQLDVRTKLCIRDSLYRLARSAQQRHNLGASGSSIRNGGDKSEVTTIVEQDRCTRLVDVETHTNSIDRSIAQLLFHRPSGPANGSVSLQSHAKIHGSTMSHLSEEVCGEEISSNVDAKMQIIDQSKGSSEFLT